MAILLLLGVGQRFAALLVLVLLLSFTAAVSFNLLRGREIDCGCFGASAMRPITWLTVGRNFLLSGAAGLVIWKTPGWVSIWGGAAASDFQEVAAWILATVLVAAAILIGELLHLRNVRFDPATELIK